MNQIIMLCIYHFIDVAYDLNINSLRPSDAYMRW